jgi:uncharacterized protein YndB with AHSA1/START domain
MRPHVATARIEIAATREEVWRVLTDSESAGEYMFGSTVETDWQEGSPIRWQGVWQEREYTDTGTILEVEPGRRLVHTHFTPLSGDEDVPENRHTLVWTLEDAGPSTMLTLEQDNNRTPEEAEHSRGMWEQALAGVKRIAERPSRGDAATGG